MKVTRWDRFLMSLAPKWAINRVRARAAADAMSRHFDAAGGGRRTSGWHRSSGDANASHGPHLATLRELSRDLRRNNGWARRGIGTIANNTVGWGIQPKAQASSRTTERARQIWKDWGDTVACDFDGRMPIYGLQHLAMTTIAESGEVLILRRTTGSDSGLPVPLQLQVVEPDLLDTSKDGMLTEGGGRILQGIEYDAAGRRVAYWLFPDHPGGQAVFGRAFASKRVPAKDVIHAYEVERPGQARGVPWLCAAIAKLEDLDGYEDAALVQKRIAACFGAFVGDPDGAGTPIGEEDKKDPKLEEIEPGHVQYLKPGQTVTFATPPVNSDHVPFTSTSLRGIAAGLGVTFEDLTGNYSEINFSASRMARMAHYQFVHSWRWSMFIPQVCDGIWRWLMEDAAALGLIREAPTAKWTPPPMPLLEPEKEGLAYQRLLRSGAMTFGQMCAERGEDPEQQLAEIAEYNAKLDDLGIVLDSDPRRTSAAGLAQVDAGDDDDSGGDDDDTAAGDAAA